MYPSRRSGSGRMSVTTWIQEGWNGRSARASVNRGSSARRTAVQATRLGIIPGRGSHLRGLVVEARVPPELLPRLRVHVIDLHGGRSVYLAQPLPRCAAPSPAGSNGEFPKAATVRGGINSRKIDRHLANTRFCRCCHLSATLTLSNARLEEGGVRRIARMRWTEASFTNGQPPPSPRSGHSATVVNGGEDVVVFGGLHTSNFIGETVVLSLSEGRW